ncbi:MAG: citryl-CoA lyase [Gammaproteobacteria bacterium]|jgi:citrate synthase|nr:citryl-CoA lyase [Gammaproteobacteria bacterium]
MKSPNKPTTRLCTHSTDAITVRGADLVDELIGELSFTEMTYFAITGRRPTPAQTRILDAVLVTLMEHGLTPSAIATRMIYGSTPESLQAGVSAGLLAVGSVFVGTMEGCAGLIERILAAPDGEATAREIADEYRSARKPIPGFGHHMHKPDDPRTPKLFALAESEGVPGHHIAALRTLSAAVDERFGKHITVNATGAIGALLGEIEIPTAIMRGIAVISRSAGLVAHIAEEQQTPSMRYMWDLVEENVPYEAEPHSGD